MMRRAASSRRASTVLAALTVVSLLGGCAATSAPDAAPTRFPSHDPLAAGALQDPARDAEWRGSSRAFPTSVVIPAIGVDSDLESLGIDADGALSPPADYDRPGWFAGGVVPGEIGPAIIAGHVDSPTAPAVFARVGELAPGARIGIRMSDGSEVSFLVTGAVQSAKAEFPTSDVYSAVPRPEIRLITCAGAFDREVGHYTDNLIVFATLAG